MSDGYRRRQQRRLRPFLLITCSGTWKRNHFTSYWLGFHSWNRKGNEALFGWGRKENSSSVHRFAAIQIQSMMWTRMFLARHSFQVYALQLEGRKTRETQLKLRRANKRACVLCRRPGNSVEHWLRRVKLTSLRESAKRTLSCLYSIILVMK